MFVIADSTNTVVFGPQPWSAHAFGLKLRELLEADDSPVGSVALGAEAPAGVLTWPGCAYRVLPCSVIGAYDPETQVLDHPVATLVAATTTPVDRPLAEVQALRVVQSKREAERRILAVAPEYKQRNLTARAAELALLYPGVKGVDLPEPLRTEYLAGQAVWDAIKAIRIASNALEAWALAEGRTVEDLRTMAGAPGWPETV